MKIKFRGITEDGKNIFSDSIQFDVDGKGREFCRLKDEFGNWLYVAPESIAQFVGYDADGKEIYEGDALLYKNETESVPAESWFALAMNIYPAGTKLKEWHLKERGENENLS